MNCVLPCPSLLRCGAESHFIGFFKYFSDLIFLLQSEKGNVSIVRVLHVLEKIRRRKPKSFVRKRETTCVNSQIPWFLPVNECEQAFFKRERMLDLFKLIGSFQTHPVHAQTNGRRNIGNRYWQKELSSEHDVLCNNQQNETKIKLNIRV